MKHDNRPAEEAREVGAALVDEHHQHLRVVLIEYVWLRETPISKRKEVWARVRLKANLDALLAARHRGTLDKLAPEELADYDPPAYAVIEVSRPAWEVLEPWQRRALIDHELCHLYRDDCGTLSLVPHDLEEFGAVVERHGMWRPDVEWFAEKMRGQDRLPFEEPPLFDATKKDRDGCARVNPAAVTVGERDGIPEIVPHGTPVPAGEATRRL